MVEQFSVAGGTTSPAILITRNAAILPDIFVGMIDASEIIFFQEGDFSDTILIVLPEAMTTRPSLESVTNTQDAAFLEDVKRFSPDLADLAARTVAAIRAAGVDGTLIAATKGRWVNHPRNTFTLKAQPHAGNLHFTLYGNPETYTAGEFLRKDQNSYSREWIREKKDIPLFTELARQAQLVANDC